MSQVTGYTEEEIKEAYKSNMSIASLNKTVQKDDSTNKEIELQETISSKYNIEEHSVSKIYIENFIKSLTEGEQQVIKLRLQDKTQIEIAKTLHISQVNVSRILSRIGKKYKEENGMIKKTPSKKSEIIQLIKEGLTNKEIAKKIKTPTTTVAVYRTQFNKNIREKAENLVNQGKSYTEVSNLLNIKYDLLLTICEVTKVKPKTSKEEIFQMFNKGKDIKQIRILTKSTIEQLRQYREEWASKSFLKDDSKNGENNIKEVPKKEQINIKEEIRKNLESGEKDMNENINVVKSNITKEEVKNTPHILKATQFSGDLMDYNIADKNIRIVPKQCENSIGISKEDLPILIEELKELQEVL